MIYKKEYITKKDKVSAVGNASVLQMLEKSPISKTNNTGIPTAMKEKAEAMSGLSFDDVSVHYNSDKPAPLQALAYTQGNEVFIGPGQEQHLGHELGHVVQQKQSRVKPTAIINQLAVNTERSLELEADQYKKKL